MNLDNQAILQAILGTGAVQPGTTWNTGIFGSNDNSTMGNASTIQPQQPQMQQQQSPINSNPVHMNTIQSFFSGPQSTFGNNLQTPARHTPGRDSWSSGMGLDPQAIYRNINQGGQNA